MNRWSITQVAEHILDGPRSLIDPSDDMIWWEPAVNIKKVERPSMQVSSVIVYLPSQWNDRSYALIRECHWDSSITKKSVDIENGLPEVIIKHCDFSSNIHEQIDVLDQKIGTFRVFREKDSASATVSDFVQKDGANICETSTGYKLSRTSKFQHIVLGWSNPSSNTQELQDAIDHFLQTLAVSELKEAQPVEERYNIDLSVFLEESS